MNKLLLLSSLFLTTTINAQDEIFFGKFEDYFVGPLGCVDNCIVAENTDFLLHWSASNAANCSINNINNLANQGPYTVVGGISQTTDYTINCPAAQMTEYQLALLKQETFSFVIPEDQNIMLRNIDGETLMINLYENSNLNQYKQNNKVQLKQIDKHLWFAQVDIPLDFNFAQSLGTIQLSNINAKENYDKIWLMISEQDPNKHDIDYALNNGRCDSFSNNPALNISTKLLFNADTETECVLDANKKYYVSKYYFTQISAFESTRKAD